MAGEVQAGWLGVTSGHFRFPEFICLKSVVTGNQKKIGSSLLGMRMKPRPGEKYLWFLDRSFWHLEHFSPFSFKSPGAGFYFRLHPWGSKNVAVWGNFLYNVVHWITGTACADGNQNQPAGKGLVHWALGLCGCLHRNLLGVVFLIRTFTPSKFIIGELPVKFGFRFNSSL